MALPVIGLNAFLPWGPVFIAGIGVIAGGLYAQAAIQRRRIRDALFDTGPNGIVTYYDWFRSGLYIFLRWLVFLMVAAVIALQAGRWIALVPAFADRTTLGIVGVVAAIALYTGFGLGRTLASARLWLVLELRGMRYEVRNGRRLRIRFIHKSGATTVDDATWEARIEAEQLGLSQNDSQIHEYLKALLLQLLRVGLWFAALSYGADWATHLPLEGLFSALGHRLGQGILYFHLDIIVPAIVAARRLPVPFASLLIVIMDRLVYACGAQFAFLVHVREPADERIDLKNVLEQRATGNAGFASGRASRKSVGP